MITKYRAWDAKEQKMHDWESLHHFTLREALGPKKTQDEEDFTFEQFTGLKDKNGKEIYGGDIVQSYVVQYPSRLEVKDKVYVVKWGLFGFTLDDVQNPNLMSYYVSPEYLEVIGNIHQNPELLNPTN